MGPSIENGLIVKVGREDTTLEPTRAIQHTLNICATAQTDKHDNDSHEGYEG